MEGILCVPPDRGTIIGRAIWKSRYVVVGPRRDVRLRQPVNTSSGNQTSRSLSKTPSEFSGLPSHSQSERATTPLSPSGSTPDILHLSIFKNKGDAEPVQQYAVTSITSCSVQMLAHRKQGPVLPTLVIAISADPTTERLWKRRSSRTTGLTSSKDSSTSTLWFRSPEDGHHQNKHILHEWCRCIHLLLPDASSSTLASGSIAASMGPLSSIVPVSPNFSNPFGIANTSWDTVEPAPHHRQIPQQIPAQKHGQFAHRPGSDNTPSTRGVSHGHKPPAQTNQTYSDSPSLRSRRSDLSHASSNMASHAPSAFGSNGNNSYALPPFQKRPADLPSPATTVGESSHQGEFVEGWSSTQGRSSSVSSPICGRDSISSQPPLPSQRPSSNNSPAISSSSPVIPRETILDRAFQMRFIPGSDRDLPGTGNLSSLARFEALMREEEERRRSANRSKFAAALPRSRSARVDIQPKSGWDLDDDDDEDEDEDMEEEEQDVAGGHEEEEEEEDDDDDDSSDHGHGDSDGINSIGLTDGRAHGKHDVVRDYRFATAKALPLRRHDNHDPAVQITPNARKALDFIASRHKDVSQDGHFYSSSRQQPMLASSPPSLPGTRAYDPYPGTPAGQSGNAIRDGTAAAAKAPKTLDSGYSFSQYDDPPSILQSQQQQQPLRPQTGYSQSRPAFAQRTHSQPQLAALNIGNLPGNQKLAHHNPSFPMSPISLPTEPAPPVSSAPHPMAVLSNTTGLCMTDSARAAPSLPSLQQSAVMGSRVSSSQIPSAASVAPAVPVGTSLSSSVILRPASTSPSEKRLSVSSTKRLSFTEFTKRLSTSTSSLLLLPNNSNNGSTAGAEPEPPTTGVTTFVAPGVALGTYSRSGERGKGSTAAPGPQPHQSPQGGRHHYHHSTSKVIPPPPPAKIERCGWRGSVGVLGTEGGFL